MLIQCGVYDNLMVRIQNHRIANDCTYIHVCAMKSHQTVNCGLNSFTNVIRYRLSECYVDQTSAGFFSPKKLDEKRFIQCILCGFLGQH